MSPYLSLVGTGARVGAGAGAGVGAGAGARVGAGAGAGTAMAGSSSEAGLSLTLSWGVGAGNRPDTLKLMSADRRSGLRFQGLQCWGNFLFPRDCLDCDSPSPSHRSLPAAGSRRGLPQFTEEKLRLSVQKQLPAGLVGSAWGCRDRSWSGGHLVGHRGHEGAGAHGQAGASPPGKRVSAFCIRASTTPTTWMDDTEAASSWAWSLAQKEVK